MDQTAELPRPNYGKILAFGKFFTYHQTMSPSGLETLNKLPLSTPVDLVSNIMPTKDSKLDKEELPVMLLKMLTAQSLSSVQFINRTPTKK